jgi:hypothetical protein
VTFRYPQSNAGHQYQGGNAAAKPIKNISEPSQHGELMNSLDDPANPAKTLLDSAAAFRTLLDSARLGTDHPLSGLRREQFFVLRSILRTAIRSLCVVLTNAHSQSLIFSSYRMEGSEWTEDEIETLRALSPNPIIIRR